MRCPPPPRVISRIGLNKAQARQSKANKNTIIIFKEPSRLSRMGEGARVGPFGEQGGSDRQRQQRRLPLARRPPRETLVKQRHLWMERRQLPTPAPNLPPPGCPPAAGLRRPGAARMGAAESRAVAAPLQGRAAGAGRRARTVSPPAAESPAASPVARRGSRRNRAAPRRPPAPAAAGGEGARSCRGPSR